MSMLKPQILKISNAPRPTPPCIFRETLYNNTYGGISSDG